MSFTTLILACVLATLSFAQSDNCTTDDVLNCFLSDSLAIPFCSSYLQISLVTETVIPPTLIPISPTMTNSVTVETIDPTAVPAPSDPTNSIPILTSFGPGPIILQTELPATPTLTDARSEIGVSDIIPTMSTFDPSIIIGPLEPITFISIPAPTPTCLSQADQMASDLISSACGCLDIVPGTTTVLSVPTWTGSPRGGNGTDGGNATSIIDPSGYQSTRRRVRPTRGLHKFSRL